MVLVQIAGASTSSARIPFGLTNSQAFLRAGAASQVGNPDSGPYTWPSDATSAFQAKAPIVNLPPANTHRGLFAWAALSHETAGHDILHADDGLQDELSRRVREALNAATIGAGLADYWSQRIDETASDVMGILNMDLPQLLGWWSISRA
jgi:hypothetical protein